MELNKFIQNFAEQFDETDIEVFTAETNFNEIDEWSSLTALSILAMIDEEYDVKLTGDDMRKSKTVGDIFNIVKLKANA